MKNIITAAVIAAATFTATTASAFTVRDCPAIAEVARAVTDARDGGLSLKLVRVMVQSAGFKPDVEKSMLEITDLAFRSPYITPEDMELMTLQVCVDQFSADT
jgi:hypothetical protein